MSLQKTKAVRNLFRTFLRLTKDVERAASESYEQTPIASLLARHAEHNNIGKQVMTVGDLRSHIRQSFRQDYSRAEDLKDQLSKGIQGIRRMESLLQDIESSRSSFDTKGEDRTIVDDSWMQPVVDQVQWLPSLEDEYSHGTCHGDPRKAHDLVELPMFPLSGAFFTPNLPLELFTSYSYGEFPTPGAEIMLKIFEPRYRELYNDLVTQPSNRRFVVPFAHPYQPATFAQYGLIYQITDWQEVADETNGVYQYVCNHVVSYPCRLHRVLNPGVYISQETYLRVEGKIEMDDVELDLPARKEIEKALVEHTDETVAKKCRDTLFTEGVWGFIRSWNTSLQQQLLQIELQIAAIVKIEIQEKFQQDPPSEKVKEIIERVQNQRRAELLRLKLDLALSIPRVLQTRNCQERLQVILDLIGSRPET